MLDISHLGDRIRSHRKKKLMTIKTLSQYTGLSVGYLSTLEQNKTTPNIENLAKICEILDVSITDILQMEGSGSAVIRKKEIRIDEYPEENMSVGIIDFKKNNQVLEYITIKPGEPQKRAEYRHVSEEMGTVLKGTMSVDIEGEHYELCPGDSIYIRSGECHRIYNQTDEEVLSLWVYTRNFDKLL